MIDLPTFLCFFIRFATDDSKTGCKSQCVITTHSDFLQDIKLFRDYEWAVVIIERDFTVTSISINSSANRNNSSNNNSQSQSSHSSSNIDNNKKTTLSIHDRVLNAVRSLKHVYMCIVLLNLSYLPNNMIPSTSTNTTPKILTTHNYTSFFETSFLLSPELFSELYHILKFLHPDVYTDSYKLLLKWKECCNHAKVINTYKNGITTRSQIDNQVCLVIIMMIIIIIDIFDY